MSKDIKTLRQYAKLRKLPSLIKLGTLTDKLRLQLYVLSEDTEVSNERALENRKGIYGVDHDHTSPLGKTYNQKHLNEKWSVGIDCLNKFENKFDWRFAELNPGGFIPMHLDDPYSYRFIAVLYGGHIFRCLDEQYTETKMMHGDVYFVNPAFRHSVENIDNEDKRIALLGKMEINEHNTELLRARA